MSARAPSRRYDSVQQDWRGILPTEKAEVFANQTRELENAYLMLSVSLNEAMGLRRHGSSEIARQEMKVVGELCKRLSLRLSALLHCMTRFARVLVTLPNVAPFEVSNFQSEHGQWSARLCNILDHVLFSERSQFLHKLSTLQEIVGACALDFVTATSRLGSDSGPTLPSTWQSLDTSHFDLNTCLRESTVLFKSFLFVLPEDSIGTFQAAVIEMVCASTPAASSSNTIGARRNLPVAGE
ncbi:MAG TPA: hypothetical protein VMT51_14960 [Dongiaceae bacterium]|nr:hypothetical protein [Dongiaceae bacterium]